MEATDRSRIQSETLVALAFLALKVLGSDTGIARGPVLKLYYDGP